MTINENENLGFEIDSSKLPSMSAKPKLVYFLALWALLGVAGQVMGFVALMLTSFNAPQNIEALLQLVFIAWLLTGILRANLAIQKPTWQKIQTGDLEVLWPQLISLSY